MSDISKLTDKNKLNEWLQGMYSQDLSAQKSEIKTLFTQIQDTKLTDNQRAALTANKETLEEQVKQLEAEMEVLKEDIAKSQDDINKKADEISELLVDIKSDSKDIEEDQKRNAKSVVEEVLRERKNNPNLGADEMVAKMRKYMQQYQFKNNSKYANMTNNISLLESKQDSIKNLIEGASKLIDNQNNLERRYGVTKSTYDLITSNLAAGSLNEGSFTNVDLSADKPIFSATKLETLVPYFDNTAINVEAGANSNYNKDAQTPALTLNDINTKYKNYLKTERTKDVDIDSYENAAVQNLGKAISEGLLDDLKAAGIHGNDLVNFFTENFAGANIRISDKTNAFTIPYGHGAQARAIYTSITTFLDNQTLGNNASNWNSDFFKGTTNTWDQNKGNTISSNNQIKSLSENFDTIAAQMKEKGFTFKEAMYAMFNQDNGLFKDCGIIYDLSKQTDSLNYYMEYAGDDDTAKLFKNVATTIFNNWGVKPNMCTDYDKVDSYTQPSEIDYKRNDPISFVDGDSEYSFVIDRNADGRFDGINEFVGGDSSKTWLDDLKSLDTNGDGILEGDELSNLKILQSKINDNAATSGEGNAKSETTTINYSFTNAKDLGIEKIDLNNLENNVNQKTGKTDLNNSETFNDSFKFILNGKEITAKRKDDTTEYMNTVYGNVFGSRIDNKFGLTESEIDSTIESDYAIFEAFKNGHKTFENNVNNLKNFDETLNEAKDYVKKAETDSENEVSSIIKQGQFKAEAQYGDESNWMNYQEKVISIAKERGIDTSATDFLEQVKGIYITNGGSYNAEQIVDEYINIQNTINSSQFRREHATDALKALVACGREGIQVKMDDIFKLIEEGKATTAEEILEYYKKQNQTEQNTDNN